MKTQTKKKFSDLFTEETGGDAGSSNVSSDSATSGLSGLELRKRKELEESESK